jgi:hypothetical protein
MDISFKGPPK